MLNSFFFFLILCNFPLEWINSWCRKVTCGPLQPDARLKRPTFESDFGWQLKLRCLLHFEWRVRGKAEGSGSSDLQCEHPVFQAHPLSCRPLRAAPRRAAQRTVAGGRSLRTARGDSRRAAWRAVCHSWECCAPVRPNATPPSHPEPREMERGVWKVKWGYELSFSQLGTLAEQRRKLQSPSRVVPPRSFPEGGGKIAAAGQLKPLDR